jgi:hypothetical protein
MRFRRLIRWLGGLPPSYALGVLWWGESTVLLCSLAGGYLLSAYLFDNLKPSWQSWLFPLALVTWLVVFYVQHTAFAWNSALMEGLVNIHRLGGIRRVDLLLARERDERGEGEEGKGLKDPFAPPERIRASAESFKVRYFVVLPSAFVLYLLGFASTIYRIFARQVHAWEPGVLVLPALAAALVACVCYWLLMPMLPGYISVRGLLWPGKSEGE